MSKYKLHRVKSARIRKYSGQGFPAFALNTEGYKVSLCIQSKCRKIRTRITPNTDTFHVVLSVCFRMIDLTLFVCAIEIESNTIQSSIENIISIQQ